MKTSYLQRPHKNAFTLIELLIVIAIIGILAGLIVVNLGGVRERGRDTQRKNDMKQLQTALRLYYNDYQTYPASDTDYQIVVDSNDLAWGIDSFTLDNTIYMQDLPADPLAYDIYSYHYWRNSTNGDRFCAWAMLENESDQQIEETRGKCQSICPTVYNETTGAPTFMVCSQ